MMKDSDVKFILTKNVNKGDEKLFELIVSVVMHDPIVMYFNVLAIGISDDVKRVQSAFTLNSIRDISSTIGIPFYAIHVVDCVFGELFSDTSRYDFNVLKKVNEDFANFMSEVSKKFEITIDEVISSFNKNKC